MIKFFISLPEFKQWVTSRHWVIPLKSYTIILHVMCLYDLDKERDLKQIGQFFIIKTFVLESNPFCV